MSAKQGKEAVCRTVEGEMKVSRNSHLSLAGLCVCARADAAAAALDVDLKWLQEAPLTVTQNLASDPLLAAQLRVQVEAVHRRAGHALATELQWLLALFRLRATLFTLEGGESTSLPSSPLFRSFLLSAYDDRAKPINQLLRNLSNWFVLAEEQGRARRSAHMHCGAGFLHPDQTPIDYADLFLQEMLIPPPQACRQIKRKCFELVAPSLRAIKTMCFSQQKDLALQLRTYLHASSSSEVLKRMLKRDLEPSPPLAPPSRSSSNGGSTANDSSASTAEAAAASVDSASQHHDVEPASKKHKRESSPPRTEELTDDDGMIDEESLLEDGLGLDVNPTLISVASPPRSQDHARPIPIRSSSRHIPPSPPHSQPKAMTPPAKRTRKSPASSSSLPGNDPVPRPPLASTLRDEPWQASCANDFRELLQRYPLHFAAAPRVTAAAADAFLLSSDPMDAAFIVTDLMVHVRQHSAQSDQSALPQFKATALAEALVDDSVTKVIHQQDGSGELKVGGTLI